MAKTKWTLASLNVFEASYTLARLTEALAALVHPTEGLRALARHRRLKRGFYFES